MVNVGIAGIGFMGVTHFKALAQVPGAQVTAICTRNEKKLAGDWSTVHGNFGESGGVQDLTNITGYREVNDLIADDAIELLDICLPTGLHPGVTIAALEAGKHVLVEKPIALTTADADRMIAAAKANDRMLMVAHVVRFIPQWRFVKDALDSGEYGRLLALNLKRIIAMPDWSDTIRDWGDSGGPLIDLHIHDVDFMLFLLGQPKRVYVQALKQNGAITYYVCNYDYGDGPVVGCQGGVASTNGRNFQHGFDAYFEQATIAHTETTEPDTVDPKQFQSATHALTVYHPDGTAEHPALDGDDGFYPQLEHAVACVANNQVSPIIDARFGRESLALIQREIASIEAGVPVDV